MGDRHGTVVGSTPSASSGGGRTGTVVGHGSRKKKGGGGIGGFFSHLGSDISNATIGLGTGIATLGESVAHDVVNHPVTFAFAPAVPWLAAKDLYQGQTGSKVIKPVLQSYKQTYGPLTHGDFNKFFDQLYEHPLGPILDVATIATAGAGGVVKAGAGLSKAGLIADESRLAKLGDLGSITLHAPHGGDTFVKATSRNPLIRARKAKVDQLFKSLDRLYGRSLGQLDALPADLPVFSETARYGRATRRASEQKALSTQLLDRRYRKAINLNKRELMAVNLYGPGVHPRDLARLPQFANDARWSKVLNDPKLHALVDNPTPKVARAIDEARILSGHGAQLAIDTGFLKPETVGPRLSLGVRRVEEQLGEPITPLPGERFYLKDVATAQKGGFDQQALRGGGKGVQRSYIHENKNVLFDMGRLLLHEDVIGPEFARRVKVSLYDDLHTKLTAAGHLIHEGEKVPRGYEYQRRKQYTKAGRPKPEVIPTHVQQAAEHSQALDALVPNADELHTSPLGEGFTTKSPGEAEKVGNQYVVVPSSLVKAMTGEFHKSSPTIRLLNKPLSLWRALVLGGRIGFFTNNVVGNALLYAIHNAGPQGLAALFRRTLTPEEMAHYFPEQVQGTFGGTQKVGGTIGRVTRKAGLGVLPATQAVSEGFMRRSAVEAALRKNPAVKKIYRQMPKQTRDFKLAAKKALEDPLIQQEVTGKVNAALGDYLGLSQFERTVVRQLVPFYAWYRAIATITLKLAVDNPARANLLSKIGQIGSELTQQKIGPTESFLRGALPVGQPQDGFQKILTTQGINPFSTVPQEFGALGATVGLGGKDARRELLGSLNPFLAGILNTAAGQGNAFGGPAAPGGFVGGMTVPLATGLPQWTLLQRAILGNQPGGGKPTRYHYDRLAAILSFLGVPLKDLNLAVEHAKAQGG